MFTPFRLGTQTHQETEAEAAQVEEKCHRYRCATRFTSGLAGSDSTFLSSVAGSDQSNSSAEETADAKPNAEGKEESQAKAVATRELKPPQHMMDRIPATLLLSLRMCCCATHQEDLPGHDEL